MQEFLFLKVCPLILCSVLYVIFGIEFSTLHVLRRWWGDELVVSCLDCHVCPSLVPVGFLRICTIWSDPLPLRNFVYGDNDFFVPLFETVKEMGMGCQYTRPEINRLLSSFGLLFTRIYTSHVFTTRGLYLISILSLYLLKF